MIENLKDKYVFFDVDGTLSEYIYNYIDKIKKYSNPNYKCDIKVVQDGDHIFF